MKLAHALRTHSVPALAALALLAGSAVRPASAQTLTFDNLKSEQGATTDVFLPDANGGDRTISGVTFNKAVNSDWEIIGNQYKAPLSSTVFAQSHSGHYALVGNAYSGVDTFGTTYTGLTVTTTQALTGLYFGYDDNGGGSNDVGTLTITAFGTAGDLASDTATPSSTTLSLFDTSGKFSGLTGVTGYRFETTASNALYMANGQAYLVADDLMFRGTPTSVPEPSGGVSLALGLALLGGAAAQRARRKRGA